MRCPQTRTRARARKTVLNDQLKNRTGCRLSQSWKRLEKCRCERAREGRTPPGNGNDKVRELPMREFGRCFGPTIQLRIFLGARQGPGIFVLQAEQSDGSN